MITKILKDKHFLTDLEVFNYLEDVKFNPFFSPKMDFLYRYGDVNKSFLDIGCFLGFHIYHLRDFFKSLKGIDIDPEPLFFAKKLCEGLSNISFECIDLFSLEGVYDVILLSEVIEHINNPRDVLIKIFSLLSPGGILIITTPSAIGITNILLNIKNKDFKYVECEERGFGTENEHIYCWDKLTLFRLCNSVGFNFIEYDMINKFSIFKGQSIVLIVQKPI